MFPRLPTPGSAKGPPVLVTISATGVKNGTVCVIGLKEPAPVWKDPVPLFGRQTPTSSSGPHSLKLGVHGRPLPHVVVPASSQPPIRRSSARLEFPANAFPRPNGKAYTTLL